MLEAPAFPWLPRTPPEEAGCGAGLRRVWPLLRAWSGSGKGASTATQCAVTSKNISTLFYLQSFSPVGVGGKGKPSDGSGIARLERQGRSSASRWALGRLVPWTPVAPFVGAAVVNNSWLGVGSWDCGDTRKDGLGASYCWPECVPSALQPLGTPDGR